MRTLLKTFLILSCLLIATDAWSQEEAALPYRKGEKVTFAIKKLGVKMGEATLVFGGKEMLNGSEYYLITFTAEGINFFDEEKIYADVETFYPVVVKRDLDIWGKKEKITEEYLTDKGHVRIVKVASGKTTEKIIEKTNQLDNIYCFIYRYRAFGSFNKNEPLAVNLPTKDLLIELDREVKFKAAGNIYDAYYLRSKPNKYKLWLDAGENKIPLRIIGAIGFHNTAMTMIGYDE